MTQSLQYQYGGNVVQIGRTIAAARDAMAAPGNVIPLTRFDTARPKITPGNSTFAPMIIDADPREYDRPHVNTTGVEYVSNRQMCWACAGLFVVIVAVSFGPWWL